MTDDERPPQNLDDVPDCASTYDEWCRLNNYDPVTRQYIRRDDVEKVIHHQEPRRDDG